MAHGYTEKVILGDGNCFFSALYESALDLKLLPKITNHVGIPQNASKEDFILEFRKFLANTIRNETDDDVIKDAYNHFQDTNAHNLVEITKAFPIWSRNIVRNLADTEENFRKSYAAGIKKDKNWVGPIDVEITQNILKKCDDIRLRIFNTPPRTNFDFSSLPNTLFIINTGEVHYNAIIPKLGEEQQPENSESDQALPNEPDIRQIKSISFYNIRLWTSIDEYKIYVFVGSYLHEKLKAQFHKFAHEEDLTESEILEIRDTLNIEKQEFEKYFFVSENVRYVPCLINPDDNIDIITKKIAVSIGKGNSPEQIYLWFKRDIPKESHILYNFIHNCYQNSARVRYEVLRDAISNYFDIDIKEEYAHLANIDKEFALKILSKLDIQYTLEPLMFKYVSGEYFEYVNYDPLKHDRYYGNNKSRKMHASNVLESFEIPTRGIIDMIMHNDFAKYSDDFKKHFFPTFTKKYDLDSIKKIVKSLNTIEKNINKYVLDDQYSSYSSINYVAYKVNEFNLNDASDLNILFDALHTTPDLPLIKYKTKSNIFYKSSKKYLSILDPNDKWIENEKKIDKHSVVDKIHLRIVCNTSFADVVIYENLTYDVTFRLGKSTVQREADVLEYHKTINKSLRLVRETYKSQYIPLLPTKTIKNDETYFKINHLLTNNRIRGLTKSINFENFENYIVSDMIPYFGIFPSNDTNVLVLEYKKVNNYTSTEKIETFIQKNRGDPDIITKIMQHFQFDEDTAKREWIIYQESALDSQKKPDYKPFFRNRNECLVRINKNTRNELIFEIMGLKNLTTGSRIVDILKIVLKHSFKKLKARTGKSELEGLYDDLLPSTKSDDIDDDFDFDYQREMEDFMNDLAGQKEPAALPVNVEQEKAPVKRKYDTLLDKLKEADPDLFRDGYARKCQQSSRRQPVVINKEEADRLKLPFVKVGSTFERYEKNFYVCPQVWCPISRTAYMEDEFNKLPVQKTGKDKNGKIIEYRCPNGELEQRTLGNPGYFSDTFIRPDNVCLPECFKTPKDNEKRMCKLWPEEDLRERTGAIEIDKNDEKYILNETFPIPENRFASLFDDLAQSLQNVNCYGVMSKDTKCFLRKGIDQRVSPFVACIVHVLDNMTIGSNDDLLRYVERIPILQFMAAENGKLLKYFVDENFVISNPDDYTEFRDWYMASKQSAYRSAMEDSTDIYRILDKNKVYEPNVIFEKDIMREFLIYNAWRTFKSFIKNKNNTIDHRILLDIVNNDHEKLNIHKYNFIIIEFNPVTKKHWIVCPTNKNVKNAFHLQNEFVFILTDGKYYEPIVYVEVGKNGKIEQQFSFPYHNPHVKNIIDFAINNCRSSSDVPSTNIVNYVISEFGNPSSYIIDYSFKIQGVLTNRNLYIPFIQKLDLVDVDSTKFTYFNHVVRNKCSLDKEEITNILNKLNKYTRSSFYDIRQSDGFLQDKDENLIAVILKNKLVIPLNLNRNNMMYRSFLTDLEIFIGYESTDLRANIIESKERTAATFVDILRKVQEYLDTQEDTRIEINFLKDKSNPFSISYRRYRLKTIVDGIFTKIKVDKLLSPKLTENLLFDLAVIKFNKSKRFSVNDDEILFDFRDIVSNKLEDIIEYQKNPFKVFNEHINEVLEAYVFERDDNEQTSSVDALSSYLPEDSDLFGKIDSTTHTPNDQFPGFEVIENHNYRADFLYEFFVKLYSVLHPNDEITVERIKSIIYNQLVEDWNKTNKNGELIRANELEVFKNNPSGVVALNNKKSKNWTLADCEDLIKHNIHYYPSFYEIAVLCKIVNVNVLVVQRKDSRYPDGKNFMYAKSSPHFVVLKQNNDNIEKHHQYRIIVKDRVKILLKLKDFNEKRQKDIRLKKNTYIIRVIDDA